MSSEANQNVALKGDLVLQVWVHTVDGSFVEACSLLLSSVQYQGSLLVADAGYGVAIQIQQVYVDKITVQYSAIGFISTLTLKLEINNGFRLFMPYINTHLMAHSVPVPHNVFGIFTLSDLAIGYYDQYIYLGMTPTFLPISTNAVRENLRAALFSQ